MNRKASTIAPRTTFLPHSLPTIRAASQSLVNPLLAERLAVLRQVKEKLVEMADVVIEVVGIVMENMVVFYQTHEVDHLLSASGYGSAEELHRWPRRLLGVREPVIQEMCSLNIARRNRVSTRHARLLCDQASVSTNCSCPFSQR